MIDMYNNNYIRGKISLHQLAQVYRFNDRMINGDGYLKSVREGGTHHRNKREESQNNIEGKCAEFACYNMFKKAGLTCSYPTIQAWGKGKFDIGYDLLLNNHLTVEVKSSTLKAKSLMLEAHRWVLTSNGKVVNQDHPHEQVPDLFVMVNVGKSYYQIQNGYIMSGQMFKSCVKHRISFFNREDQIPTARSRYPLDTSNYIFPYPNVRLNTNKPVHYLGAPRKCLSFLVAQR